MGAATEEQYPTFNGRAVSWADISTTINVAGGETVNDIDYSGIKVNSQVELGEQRGASGGRVIKRTTGSKKDEASATYYRSGLKTLMRALAAVAPTRGNQKLIGLVTFDVQVLHQPKGTDDIYEVLIRGCRLIGLDGTFAEGNEADKVEINLSPGEVVWMIDGEEIVLL